MAILLEPVSLVGAVVGTTGTIDFRNQTTGVYLAPTFLHRQLGTLAHLRIHNESGCGLDIEIPPAPASMYIPAGAWQDIVLADDVQLINFTVSSVIAGASVSVIKAVYYQPGEPLPDPPVLGNSPVSGGSIVTAVTQVIQDGQPTGQTIVESTPNSGRDAGLQTILMTTDGLLKLLQLGQAAGSDNAYIELIQQANAPAVAQTIFISVNGNSGALDIFDANAGASILFGTGAFIRLPGITRLAGVNMAGSFGVAAVPALGKHITVVNTNTITIASGTTPNNGQNCWVRFSLTFFVGGGNTNNGTVTALATFTSPDTAGNSVPFFPNGGTVAIVSANVPKNSITYCVAVTMLCSPNTVAAVTYANQAAGTIADFVSGSVEFLG